MFNGHRRINKTAPQAPAATPDVASLQRIDEASRDTPRTKSAAAGDKSRQGSR
jgi:hypothetical protein